jgi:hypothetical protein
LKNQSTKTIPIYQLFIDLQNKHISSKGVSLFQNEKIFPKIPRFSKWKIWFVLGLEGIGRKMLKYSKNNPEK